MKNMTIANIISAVSGSYTGPKEILEQTISGVVTDSRKVAEGYLYIPFRGAKADGHDFIPKAFEQGALCVLSEEPLEMRFPTKNIMPYILVKSCAQALKDIAAFYRQQLTCKIVGVTGSVGKTSTKEMIASVLQERFKVQKTQGNFNNEIGLPLTICSIGEEHEVAVVEMGISEFGEMSRLGAIARPDICVMTNIGVAHLETLGSRDGILKAKTEIIDYVHPAGLLILNGDDDKLATVSQVRNCGDRILEYYGVGKESLHGIDKTAFATQIRPVGTEGIAATYSIAGETFEATIPIPGEHNVQNALAAALVGKALGMTTVEIQAGISKAATIQGRNNRFVVNGVTIIDDCYNANPVSMKASLDVLCNAPGRKIAVLGDMGELGIHENEMHEEVAQYAIDKGVDMLLCTGALSNNMLVDNKVAHFDTKEELTKAILKEVKEGDTVLIKASHFMQYETIVEALKR